jgi:hypothetical protein
MLHYFLAFFYPALMAMLQPYSKPWKGWGIWFPTSILYILFVGLRDEVGADWGNYFFMFENEASKMNYMDALHHGDPAFWLLQVWVDDMGWDVHMVNLFCAIIFVWGLVTLLRKLPNPWLGLTIAVAYTMLAVAMGYVRQSVALGLVFWAIAYIMDGKYGRFLLFVAFATAFHKSAVLMAGIGIFHGGRNKYIKMIAGLFILVGVYFAFVSGYESQYVQRYVDSSHFHSKGAYIRILMNAIPGLFLLYFRNRWKKLYPNDYTLWLLMALGSVFSLPLVPFASTVIDRLGLYFIPMQIVVLTRLPQLLPKILPPRIVTALVIGYYALAYIVFLKFAAWSFAWFPYQNQLIEWFLTI